MQSVRRKAAEPAVAGWPSSLSGLKAGEASRADLPGAGPPGLTHVKSQVDPPTGSTSGARAGSRPLEPTRAWEGAGRAGAAVGGNHSGPERPAARAGPRVLGARAGVV